MDPVGFDTHASCVNAAADGHNRVYLVSQDFHMPRAVALCQAVGVDAIGIGDTRFANTFKATWLASELREKAAAIKAVTDAYGPGR